MVHKPFLKAFHLSFIPYNKIIQSRKLNHADLKTLIFTSQSWLLMQLSFFSFIISDVVSLIVPFRLENC